MFKKYLWFAQILMLGTVSSIFRRTIAACSSTMSAESLAGVFSISYVTAPSEDVAKSLAEKLVKQKLAGCVNIVPGIQSVYEWKNEIQKDSEVLMIIKSRTSYLDDLTKFVRENHPYEVCEVISTPIAHGNPPYMKWLGDLLPDKKCQ